MSLNAAYAALLCLAAAEAAAGADVVYQPVSFHNDRAGGQDIRLSWRVAASSRADTDTGAPGEQEFFEVQESACVVWGCTTALAASSAERSCSVESRRSVHCSAV